MILREIAYARSGDKGDICNICVFPYDESHIDFIKEQLTPERVKEHFGTLVKGRVDRYEFEGMKGLNFVMHEALGGGVSMSLRSDIHGKATASLMMAIELTADPPKSAT